MTTLVRWEPFRDLTGLQGEVSRLMSGLFESGAGAQAWAPALDVWETDTELVYAFDVRTVGLPAGTDDTKITASYRDGVLEIHVPKPEEAKPRRIAVEAAPVDVEV